MDIRRELSFRASNQSTIRDALFLASIGKVDGIKGPCQRSRVDEPFDEIMEALFSVYPVVLTDYQRVDARLCFKEEKNYHSATRMGEDLSRFLRRPKSF